MKERIIESFIDCGVHILYSSPEEFLDWAEKKSVTIETDLENVEGLNKKFTLDGEEIIQAIWVNSASGRSIDKIIATFSHEATHVVDNIELFISNRPGEYGERIPRELRARMVEKIVQESYKLITEE